MTFTPAPRAKSNLNKIKKVELVEILMMYQAELDKAKGDLALATTKLENSVQRSEILTVDDYGNDFVNRCEVHGKEFNLFIKDLKFAGEFLRNKIQEVKRVELPSFIK